jgi:AraC family transcriptional regulator
VSIAIVRSGTFQYRSSAGRELMMPGSLLLGTPGQYFECGHEHGVGDRCISFKYEPRLMDELIAEAGLRVPGQLFSVLRVPVVRELSNVVALAYAAAAQSESSEVEGGQAPWEEVAVELAVRSLEIANGTPNRGSSPAQEARVTRVIRMIEDRPRGDHSLEALAREAKLSRYHFLRTFQELTSLTPHQYVRRTRLRYSATRLLLEPTRILDIVLDSGFDDVSNFNHAFQAEYGVSPRLFRKVRGSRHSSSLL